MRTWRFAMLLRPAFRPVLDPDFQPASLWNRAYRTIVSENGGVPLALTLERADGAVSVFRTAILPRTDEFTRRYVERLLKFLLWQKGGWRVIVAGPEDLAAYLRDVYAPHGARAFDHEFMGERVYGKPLTIEHATFDDAPAEREAAAPL